MANLKLATFRIDEQKWDAFQSWAKSQNSNASEVLKRFIDECLDGSIDLSQFSQNPYGKDVLENIDTRIDKRIETQIQEVILTQMDSVNASIKLIHERIDEVESKIQSLTVEEKIDAVNADGENSTEEILAQIPPEGVNGKQLAELFGVSPSKISRMKDRKTAVTSWFKQLEFRNAKYYRK